MPKTLRAVKPEAKGVQRARIIISGAAGVGKTYFALDFPGCYYIDVEGSAERDHYAKKLEDSGGAYFGRAQGSEDINTVIEELSILATVEHDYKTLVIDSFSELYGGACAVAEERVGNDFGADKKEANKPTRKLLRWINKLDMNVILICHPKDDWKDGKVVGTTFDGMAKLDHKLDVWIEVKQTGKSRKGYVRKSRIEGLETGSNFPLTFSKFSELFGAEAINKDTERLLVPAAEEQVALLDSKRREAGLPQSTVDAWLRKAKVDTLEQLPEEIVEKCLELCDERINQYG